MPSSADQKDGIAVSARGIVKTFGSGENRTQALKGVDLDARFGELLMIVGPSGCGKTTLLSVICGTLKFDAGNMHVFGNDLAEMSDAKITAFRGKNVGFIFQQFNLIPTWSALENVSVPMLLNRHGRTPAEAAAAKLLRDVGLPEKLHAYPTQLSGGQQQRVAIARALVHQPRLIICDEPTAALDAASGHKVVELLKEVACHPDRCVIVVTHDSRIFQFADRIAVMEDGKVQAVHDDPGDYHALYV
jgi:putative ABC transport system ATP-binding protein